jgi:hypothetical protein
LRFEAWVEKKIERRTQAESAEPAMSVASRFGFGPSAANEAAAANLDTAIKRAFSPGRRKGLQTHYQYLNWFED